MRKLLKPNQKKSVHAQIVKTKPKEPSASCWKQIVYQGNKPTKEKENTPLGKMHVK